MIFPCTKINLSTTKLKKMIAVNICFVFLTALARGSRRPIAPCIELTPPFSGYLRGAGGLLFKRPLLSCQTALKICKYVIMFPLAMFLHRPIQVENLVII